MAEKDIKRGAQQGPMNPEKKREMPGEQHGEFEKRGDQEQIPYEKPLTEKPGVESEEIRKTGNVPREEE